MDPLSGPLPSPKSAQTRLQSSGVRETLGQEDPVLVGRPEIRRIAAGTNFKGLAVQRQITQFVFKDSHYGTFVCSTHADPASSQITYSLGGHRRVSARKAANPKYDQFLDAAELTVGMQFKVDTARACGTAGPRGREVLAAGSGVGGKNVYLPSPQCFKGETNEIQGLKWAGSCVRFIAETTNIRPVTGDDEEQNQDSLAILNRLYSGSVTLATAIPTAHGNIHFLRGMADVLGVEFKKEFILLLGAGKVGSQVLSGLSQLGVKELHVVEQEIDDHQVRNTRGAALEKLGAAAIYTPEHDYVLAKLAKILIPNASGRSMHPKMIDALCDVNSRCRIVVGCENNMFFPEQRAEATKRLLERHVLVAPSEMVGHLGGTAALECALAGLAGEQFDLQEFLEATAEPMYRLGREATIDVEASGWTNPMTIPAFRHFDFTA